MNDLASKGFPRSRSAHLAGMARSMIHYKHKEREPHKKAHASHESYYDT